jgi:hypothetical protein
MPNPFEGRWDVSFFELRDRDGEDIGRPLGAAAIFTIATEGDHLRLTVERPPGQAAHPKDPVFEGRWQEGEDPSMSVRWHDEDNGFLYQMVAVPAPNALIGGYFRAQVPGRPMPDADSEGTGSWQGTGPIVPYDRERG